MGEIIFFMSILFLFLFLRDLSFGIYFSWSLDLVFFGFFFGLVIAFHFWLRDLLREFYKKYEILLMVLFLFFLFLASEALLFISFFWASFHSLSSPSLGIWP